MTCCLILVAGYLVSQFFGSTISTERVVAKKARTIESYADFLADESIEALFNGATSDHWSFMQAAEGSPAARVWRRVKRSSFLVPNMASFAYWSACTVRQSCVIFCSRTFASVAFSNFCSLSRLSGHWQSFNSLSRVDPSAHEQLQGLLLSSSLRPGTQELLFRSMTRALEHALLAHSYQAAHFSMSRDTRSEELADCVSNRVIVKRDTSVPTLAFLHFSPLILLSTATAVAAAAVLLIEAFVKHLSCKRS